MLTPILPVPPSVPSSILHPPQVKQFRCFQGGQNESFSMVCYSQPVICPARTDNASGSGGTGRWWGERKAVPAAWTARRSVAGVVASSDAGVSEGDAAVSFAAVLEGAHLVEEAEAGWRAAAGAGGAGTDGFRETPSAVIREWGRSAGSPR